LLFALPIGAAVAGRHFTKADWAGAGMVCLGLGVFLAVADPATGRNNARPLAWTVMLVSVAAVAGVLTILSLGPNGRRRAVLLSAATGVTYGAAAGLTKTTSHLMSRGLLPLVTHWQPYALVVFGVTGMVLAQSAFQAGALDLSLPTMTVVDPVVSIAIGASMFRESIAGSPLGVTVEVTALIVMSIGVYLLAHFEAEAARPPAGLGQGPHG
jgi:hypothetical protein